jgi:hypothetical protein
MKQLNNPRKKKPAKKQLNKKAAWERLGRTKSDWKVTRNSSMGLWARQEYLVRE